MELITKRDMMEDPQEETSIGNTANVQEDVLPDQQQPEEEPQEEAKEQPPEESTGIIPLRDIAEILHAKDPDKFVKLYETDLINWKSLQDDLYNARMTHAMNIMGELEIFTDDSNKDQFVGRAERIIKHFVSRSEIDLNDLDADHSWERQWRILIPKAQAFMTQSSTYQKIMKDYLDIRDARDDACLHYEKARDEIIENLTKDNKMFVDILRGLLPLLKILNCWEAHGIKIPDNLEELLKEYDDV